MLNINDALKAIGLGLLVLFFAVGVVKTCSSVADLKRPEHAIKLFIRFALAKAAVTYGLDLMLAVFRIVQGMVSTIITQSGLSGSTGTTLPQEIIDKIGYPVGASDTDNGVTVTADAVMGDAYNAVIVYTISRDDGTRLLPEDITGEMLLVHGNGTDLSILGGSHGSSYFVVEDPAASSIQMVETVSADKPINDCTATGVFENLYKWDEEAGEAVPIIEGKWRLKFEMTYEDSSVTLSGGETFTQDGMTFTIDSITLSPVAYKVDYTVDSEVVWSNSGSGRQSEEDRLTTQRYFENVEILLTLTDGTVIDLSNAGGSIGPEDGVTVCSKGEVFSEVLPMEDMASISVGGVVYDLTVE